MAVPSGRVNTRPVSDIGPRPVSPPPEAWSASSSASHVGDRLLRDETSARIPLLIEEPGPERAGRVWDVADHRTTGRLIYTEARAALAQASRLGRLGPAALATAIDALAGLHDQLDLLEDDDPLVRRAGELAQHHALRGYDAIHLAAAERVRHDTTILVAADRDLCATAQALGLAVARTSIDDHDG